MKPYLQIDLKDNVYVALEDLSKACNITIANTAITLLDGIPQKHKFAIEDIEKGSYIYMYGLIVGVAKKDIKKGERISIDNTEHHSSRFEIKNTQYKWQPPDVSQWENVTFNGYHRKDGKVGTSNNWLVIPLVFCENRNILEIQRIINNKLGYGKEDNVDIDTLINEYKNSANVEKINKLNILNHTPFQSKRNKIFPNVDGIKYLTHEGGCGGTREDAQALCNLLAGYIAHPNVAGATILSLGCQNAQIPMMQKTLNKVSPDMDKPIYYLEQQQYKNENILIAEAVKKTFIGLIQANKIERKPAPLSKLCIGVECGGSDGFSGISANPAVGYTSDLVVALEGSVILSEFPELNGVEQDIINRCVSANKARKFSQLMKDYNKRAEEVGTSFAANPSPGNIKDGLITDAMKSAGAAKKGGTSPVVDVLDYTEQVTKQGLSLLCSPGNDVESTTALAGSGANLILFTTGLGTPTGNPIVPTVKVSSNTQLFEKMHDIIDFDTGSIITGKNTIENKGKDLLDLVIKVASGEVSPKATLLQQDDFIPWKQGISL